MSIFRLEKGNFSSYKDFKNSTDPSFKNDNNEFDVIYIKDGGNLDKNPSSLYTLPSINDLAFATLANTPAIPAVICAAA